jgi:hypothetical protein
MHPQLEALIDEFHAAGDRLTRLAARVPDARWQERAHPDRWSIGECVAHLILTADGYRTFIEPALAAARASSVRAPRMTRPDAPAERYRKDWRGWLLWKLLAPPARLKVKTKAAFVPQGQRTATELRADFARCQELQTGWVRTAAALPVPAVVGATVVSPFDSRMSYNLFSALSILPRHQHRHLWQAENVARDLGL